jgi:hypothetical protein
MHKKLMINILRIIFYAGQKIFHFSPCLSGTSRYFAYIFSKDCSGGNSSPSRHSVRRAATF